MQAPKGASVGPSAASAVAGAASPGAAADPEKVAEAVEAARDQVETILQGDVDDKLDRLRVRHQSERGNWLATLAILAIIVSIILKVVLGSKNRAESQARQASATAAQEGLKRQLAEAQLKMMQAQVEPHFLFNTLASVDYLIETDPARASRMQKNLIQYLRAALPQMREGTSSLGREIQQCRSYLEILKVRMDERLQFSINVPQGLQSAVFPPMMLLTLVENAVKHGLEPKSEGGSLSVGALVANGALQVSVADSGLGFGVAQRGGTGVGLANVRERLQALFGAAARLQIEGSANGGTIATIIVPYRVDPSSTENAAAGLETAAAVGAAG
jgi:sensor histidine kinase YesM